MAIFNGRNVFLGYINGKDILLDKLIYRYDPSIISFGKSLSQNSYDLITPESNKYYAISSEFEQISELYNVYNLSQEEYEKLSTYDKNSLYIIKDNDEITNAYVGDTRLDKLYLGETTVWSYQKTPDWYQDGWQDLLAPDSWYYPYRVYVAAAIITNGVPNCEIMCCSFSDYYGFDSVAAKVELIHPAGGTSYVQITRSNDGKKRKWVTYDNTNKTWGTVGVKNDSSYESIGNVDTSVQIPAFILAYNVPSQNLPFITNIPYAEDL